MLRKDVRKKNSFIHLVWISLRREPVWSFIVVLMGISLGVTWGANTLFTQRLFDAAQETLQNQAKLPKLAGMLFLLGGVNLLNQIVNCIGNISHSVYQSKVKGIFSSLLQDRIGQLELIAYEDAQQLDRLERARKGMETAAFTLLIFLLLLGFYLPYCLFMLAYLASLSPWLALILPMAFMPVLLVQFLRTKNYKELELDQAPLRRECDYYKSCISDREYFKETRAKGGFGFFLKKYQQSLVRFVELERKAERKIALREFAFQGITAAGYVGSVGLLLHLTLNGTISPGAFAAVFASMNSIFSTMEEIIFFNVSQLQSNMGAVGYFSEFICETTPDAGREHPGAGSIEACGISFSYPNAGREAIHDVSLKILPGETVALVGENGSGKSTLVKLLIGQYFPTRGCVLQDNIPTTQYRRSQLGNGVSGVFQQFQKYRLGLGENVSVSQPNERTDTALIRQALARIGFDEKKTGLETMLSREFGGVDLSGGEWQKVAMARGIYRKHDFIVLDEPVAAIDPLREAQIYKLFADIAREKTVVIVTHRLSCVQFADRIVVMQGGSIAEIGTHKELLEKDGVYKRMFEAQGAWYKVNRGEGI